MTYKNNASGQAFPSGPSYGLTRREWFAGMALSGMLSNCDSDGPDGWMWAAGVGSKDGMATAAEVAFQMADAMIEEGEK